MYLRTVRSPRLAPATWQRARARGALPLMAAPLDTVTPCAQVPQLPVLAADVVQRMPSSWGAARTTRSPAWSVPSWRRSSRWRSSHSFSPWSRSKPRRRGRSLIPARLRLEVQRRDQERCCWCRLAQRGQGRYRESGYNRYTSVNQSARTITSLLATRSPSRCARMVRRPGVTSA
jgi:hypothetical protein